MALALGVSPMSMIVGFYMKDQIALSPVIGEGTHRSSYHSYSSSDFTQWWVGGGDPYWRYPPNNPEDPRSSEVLGWARNEL